MENLRFVIPQKLEDLLHAHDDPNVYYVNDELTAREISLKLPECEAHLNEDPTALCQDFEVFFSVLKNFTALEPRVVDRTWALAYKATLTFQESLKDLFKSVQAAYSQRDTSRLLDDSALNDSQRQQDDMNMSQSQRQALFESPHEKQATCNTLKMLVFTTCTFIEQFEELETSKNNRRAFNDSFSEQESTGKRVKKNKTSQQDKSKEYERYKERAVGSLLRLMSLPLHRLFDSNTGVHDVVGLIMRTSYKLLENSAINGITKNAELLDHTFNSLGCGIEKYNQSLSFCLKIIQLLQHKEQLATLLANLVVHIVTRNNQRLLIGEILREIERIDIRELTRDSSCPRAISTFLLELSEKCPKEFTPSLSHVLDFLEQDSYLMRNAALSIIGNIVLISLSHDDLDENQKQLRDELLECLFMHVQDITSYTRSKAISVWCMLSEKNAIPLRRLDKVTGRIVQRLQDKSCFVRKSAVRYLISVLQNNPFAQRLPLHTFKQKYNEEKETLKKLIEEEEQRNQVEAMSNEAQPPQESESDKTVIEDEDGEGNSDTEVENDSQRTENNSQAANKTKDALDKTLDDVTPSQDPIVIKRRQVRYLLDSILFTEHIHKSIPIICELLYSKSITDIQEAVDFFVCCHNFGIDEALVGFKKMILLINSPEKSIKETVTNAYKKIFFESSRYEGHNQTEKNNLTVLNFINFLEHASIGEMVSLEVLMGNFLASNDFTKGMQQELWARFTMKKQDTTLSQCVASIQLLGMLARSEPNIINDNSDLCVKHGLATNGWAQPELDSRFIRETCIALQKSLPKKLSIEDKTAYLKRLSRSEPLFTRLSDILVDSLHNINCTHWYSMCDEAIKVIFKMSENPEIICEKIYCRMVDELLNHAQNTTTVFTQPTINGTGGRIESPDLVETPNDSRGSPNTSNSSGNDSNDSRQKRARVETRTTSQNSAGTERTEPLNDNSQAPDRVNSIYLARFLHFIGSIALNLTVHLELNVFIELKQRNGLREEKENHRNLHNVSISSRRRSRRFGRPSLSASMTEMNLEEEIGLGGANALEDAEMEFLEAMCDDELVVGDNLLGKMSKVINIVSRDPSRYSSLELRLAATLCLAKYMMVSEKFCSEHLRLLFTILEKSKESEIKINLVIAVSDLCIRFPNLLDPWTSHLFDCLQNADVRVRKASLKVLSRLILSDMIKVKGQISNIANLMVDDDEDLSSCSRYFFSELSKKLNAIYNVLPDIISRLSDPKLGVTEENFRIVMKFLFELIDKDRHIDKLMEKLCKRFSDTIIERQWCDLAFCLSLLKYSDKTIGKLSDNFNFYKDKLCIESVNESIMSIIVNFRKTPNIKVETKQLLDDFEAKIKLAIKPVLMEGEEEEQENEEEEGEEGQEQREEQTTENNSTNNRSSRSNSSREESTAD